MIYATFYVPEDEKNDEWGQAIIRYISSYAINNQSFNMERLKNFENFDFVRGIYDLNAMKYVTERFGEVTPARFVNYDLINTKIKTIVGDWLGQPLDFYANITNQEGIDRKLRKKSKVLAEQLTKPLRAQAEQTVGMDLSDPEVQGEQSEKDSVEDFYELSLQYLIDRYNLMAEYEIALRDLCYVEKCFFYVDIVNGDPVTERKDPRSMVYDFDSLKSTLDTSNWQGCEDWLTPNQIIEKHKNWLTPEQIKELKEMTPQSFATIITNNPVMGGYYRFNTANNQWRIRSIHVVWCSVMIREWRVTQNKYDPDSPFYYLLPLDFKKNHPKQYEAMKSGKKPGVTIEEKEADDWWEGWMVGYMMFGGIRRRPDQPRRQQWGWAKSSSPYKGIIHEAIDGRTISIVDSLKNVQLLYNEVMFNIDFLLGRSMGKVIVYDGAQKPENYTYSQVFAHAKNSGFVIIDSRKDTGTRGNSYNQFGTADLSNMRDIDSLMGMASYLEKLADELTGITRARQGEVMASDAVRNTQSSIQQSNSITRSLYTAHNRAIEQTLNQMADLIKYCSWQENERMSMVLPDGGVTSWTIPEDYDLDDCGIKLKIGIEEKLKKDQFMQLAEKALSSGAIDYPTIIKMINATTTNQSLNALEQGFAVMQKMKQEEQQGAQQQAQMGLQASAKHDEMTYKIAQLNSETNIEVAKIKAQNERDMQGLDHDLQERLGIMTQQSQMNQTILGHANEQTMQQNQLANDQQMQAQDHSQEQQMQEAEPELKPRPY